MLDDAQNTRASLLDVQSSFSVRDLDGIHRIASRKLPSDSLIEIGRLQLHRDLVKTGDSLGHLGDSPFARSGAPSALAWDGHIELGFGARFADAQQDGVGGFVEKWASQPLAVQLELTDHWAIDAFAN